VHFARLRIQRLGWDAACHHSALEFSVTVSTPADARLRGPLATREWARGAVEADEILSRRTDAWTLHGVRPANHPRTRPANISAWTRVRPDWPAQLLAQMPGSSGNSSVESDEHRAPRAPALGFAQDFAALCATQSVARDSTTWSATDSCVAAANTGHERQIHGLWFHWWPEICHRDWRRCCGTLGGFSGPHAARKHGVRMAARLAA